MQNIILPRGFANGWNRVQNPVLKRYARLHRNGVEVEIKNSTIIKSMSRTLDKYGVNIRNSAMETKLAELGINATVNSLSQADKALLRTIILLDSSKYAWGDLSKTLNTPANQFRMLANNVKLLGQMIGQILLPVVAKVLPYINAFVIALQRLFTWIAKILHIDLSDLMPDKKTMGDNSGMSDILDDAEGLGDALDKDKESADKLKKSIMGFDELNVLNDKKDDKSAIDTSGLASGLLNDAFLKAIGEYLNAWDDAFAHLEDNAKNIADRIQAFFEHLASPLKKAWDEVGQYFVDSWKKAVFAVQALFKTMGKDFWKVWDEDATVEMFVHILSILGDIGMAVRNLAKNFREAWMTNDNGYHILANIRDIALTIVEHFHEMSSAVVKWTANIDFTPLLSKFASFLESLNEVIGHIMDVMVDFLNTVLLPLSTWTIEKGLPDLLQVFIDFKDKVDWDGLKEKLHTFFTYLEPFAEKVGEGLIIFIDRLSMALANFANSEKFENVLKKIEEWMDKITPEDIADFFGNLVEWLIKFKIAVAGFKFAKGLGDVVVWFSNLKKALGFGGAVAKGTKELSGLSKVVQSFTGGTGLKSTLQALKYAGSKAGLAEIFSMGTATEIGSTFGLYLASAIATAMGMFWAGKKLGGLMFPDDKEIYENFKWFGEGGFWDDVEYMFTDMIPNSLKQVGSSIKETFGNLGETISTNVGTAVDGAQEKFAEFKESVSEKFTSVKETVSEAMDTTKEKIQNGFADAKEKAVESWEDVSSWFSENVSEPIAAAFEDLKDSRLAQIFEGIGIIFRGSFTLIKEWLVDEVIEPMQEKWEAFKEFINTNIVEPMKEAWQGFKDKVTEVFETTREFVVEAWGEVSEWVQTNIIEPISEGWNQLKETVSGAIEAVWQKVQDVWQGIKDWVSQNVVEPLKEDWNNLKEFVGEAFDKLWEGIQNAWGGVTDWFKNTIIEPLKENFDKAVDFIKNAFSDAWDFLKDGFKNTFNDIIGVIERCLNSVVGGINRVIEGFNGVVGFFAQVTGDSWGGVRRLSNISLARYANGGFPKSGQLFLAREAGAEMVGSIGGRTAVANNEQITTSIKNAVYEAMMSVMSANNGFGGGDIVVNAVLKTEDDEVLARAVTRGQQQMNRRYSPIY